MTVLLAAGFALHVWWRLYLARPLTGPVAHADEDGYLLAARVMAGGADATLPTWSIMRPIGYPLVLAPIYWFTEGPAAVYRSVHVVNAVLTAAVVPLVYLLARRAFGLGRAWAVGLALVLASLPPAVFFSQFALTESVLIGLVLLVLLCLHIAMTAGGAAAACAGSAAGIAAGYSATTHSRGLAVVSVAGVAVLLGAARRWMTWPAAAGFLGGAALTLAAGVTANRWLEDQIFPQGSFVATPRIVERLTSRSGLTGIAGDGAGQIWHLCTSTWGLAAVGLAAAVGALVLRRGPRPTRVLLACGLAMTVGIAAATSAGIPYETEQRLNNHVYGRYVAILAVFWVLVAISALLRATRVGALALLAGAVAVTVGALALVFVRNGGYPDGRYLSFDSPELSFLGGDWAALHIYRVTLLALGCAAVLAVALRGRPAVGGLAVAALLGLNLAAAAAITTNVSVRLFDAEYPRPDIVRDAGVRPGDRVAQAWSVHWRTSLRDQHDVYWGAVEIFDPRNGAPPGAPEWVVANVDTGRSTDWDGSAHGYREVFRFTEPRRTTCVVWRRE